jgi:hypothetical protein
MVSYPPTRCGRARWRASVALALSAGAIACDGLLDIPGDPYVIEPAATALEPGGAAPTAADPDMPREPGGSTAPELELEDVQGGSGMTGAGSTPADGGVLPDAVVGDVSDAGLAAATCPAGAALGPSGRCYVVLQNILRAAAAQLSCNALGAGWDLAAIHDAATNEFLGTLIDDEAWIGASDQANEGTWIWVIDDIPFWSGDGETGAPVNGAFAIWAGGGAEPNGERTSDCARLVPDPPRWADLECDSRLRESLCEGPPL